MTNLPHLPVTHRYWTSMSCLAGGFDANGQQVGDPAGCGLFTTYVKAVDDPLVVPDP